MAKAQDRQLAECKSTKDYTDPKGEVRKIGIFELDGQEFEVMQSRYFIPQSGKYYYPVVSIIQKAEISKRTNNAYIRKIPAVSWQEVN